MPLLWSTPMTRDSYWTPSRCAKILVAAGPVRDRPVTWCIWIQSTWRRSTGE
ncbi:UNVERIFIED_CONTAM: hypothetical protein PYX00_006648 [Menopon gallinae]|uniref:Uncharacterized protein n=1 Tax=Menopon gallinae TaxID=328185 RepID=A0AAW2HWK0_9NEOP